MKTANLNAAPTVPSTAAQAPAAPAGCGTDFFALFNQVMEGNAASASPANLLAAGLPFAAAEQKDDAGGDLDESEVALMMAALTGAPVMPATPTYAAAGAPGDADLLAGVRAHEVAGALAVLAGPADAADGEATQLQDPTFDASPTDTAAVDPRAVQGAIDGLRDLRPQQSDAPLQRQMHAPVGTRAWGDELGAHVNWMTERGLQAASLRLSPEHLGPLEIRISIRDDQASVWFGAAHADTRAAIENALPRLRDMMASQGLALTDAGVFKEAPRQQQQFRPDRDGNREDGGGVTEAAQSVGMSRLGLVDAYA